MASSPRLFPLLSLIAGAMIGGSASAQDSTPARTTRESSEDTRASEILRFANGLLAQRKFALAADEFANLIKSEPRGPVLDEARFGLATAYLYQGRYDDSRELFKKFLASAPDDRRALSARYRIGELSYVLGDLPAAREALETFTKSTTSHPALEMAWTYLGDAYFGQSEMTRARRAYEQSLTLFPKGRLADRARYGLGRSLAELGEMDAAIIRLRALAAEGQPDWSDRAGLELGTILSNDGKFAEALIAFEGVERNAPASALVPEARFQRARLLARLNRTAEAVAGLQQLAGDKEQEIATRAALELATIELERNHADLALNAIETAIRRFPKADQILAMQFRAGEALSRLKRLAEAQQRFLIVAGGDARNSLAGQALVRAAECAIDRGEPAEAARIAASFAARFPGSPLVPQARLIEARAATALAKPERAIQILEPLVASAEKPMKTDSTAKLPSSTASIELELAIAYRAIGRREQSTAMLERIIKNSDRSGDMNALQNALFLTGQNHLEAGRHADAVGPLEKYLEAKPTGDVADHALAHLTIAQLALGQPDKALAMLSQLESRFPKSQTLASTRVRVAEAELARHQPARAAEIFRRAVESDAANDKKTAQLNIRAFTGLGRALAELGNTDDATATFARALELSPSASTAAEIAMTRAQTLESAGKGDAAITAYVTVAEKFPASELAPKANLARARLLARSGRIAESGPIFENLIATPEARQRLEKAGLGVDAVLAEWGWSLVDAVQTALADTVFSRLLKEYPGSAHEIDARFNLAESANLKGDRAEVVRLLDPVVKGDQPQQPTKSPRGLTSDASRKLLPTILYRLGRTQVELAQWNAAIAIFDRLMKEFPDNPYRREARYLGAECALRQGDAAGAEAAIALLLEEPAAANDPAGFSKALKVKQVECWAALKRWNDVLTAVMAIEKKLGADDPAAPALELARGQAFVGQGRFDEARAAFQAVIDQSKGSELAARAQLMRGETFFHQDKFPRALREFLMVDILYKQPHWQAIALLEAGKVYERLDQWKDATETYDSLCARFANDPSALEARTRRDAAKRRAGAPPSSETSR
jgi:TolA-binding protein